MMLFPASVTAQDASPAPGLNPGSESAAQSCTLSIITTENIQIADSTHFKEARIIGSAISTLYEKQDPLAAFDIANSTVGPEGQETLIMANLDLLPDRFLDRRIITEAGGQRPLAAFTAAKRSLRLSSSDDPCLAELSVVAVTYSRTSLYQKIGYLFMFREFSGAGKATNVVTFAEFNSVKAFPPKSKAEADATAARTELSNAFVKSFTNFTKKVGEKKK